MVVADSPKADPAEIGFQLEGMPEIVSESRQFLSPLASGQETFPLLIGVEPLMDDPEERMGLARARPRSKRLATAYGLNEDVSNQKTFKALVFPDGYY